MKNLKQEGWIKISAKKHKSGYYWDKKTNTIKEFFFCDKIVPTHIKNGQFLSTYGFYLAGELLELYSSKESLLRNEAARIDNLEKNLLIYTQKMTISFEETRVKLEKLKESLG